MKKYLLPYRIFICERNLMRRKEKYSEILMHLQLINQRTRYKLQKASAIKGLVSTHESEVLSI